MEGRIEIDNARTCISSSVVVSKLDVASSRTKMRGSNHKNKKQKKEIRNNKQNSYISERWID